MSSRVALLTPVAFTLLAAASPAVADPVVAGLWNMDNTFGETMVDSSGNGNDGTLINVVTSGAGYIFDGSTSLVTVPDSPTLNPGALKFTYSVKVQTNSVPGSGKDFDLMRKGISATSGGEFKVEIVRSNGKGVSFCQVIDSKGKSVSVKGSSNVADGNPHTISCTKNSTHLILQVDNKTPKKTKKSLGSISNSSEITIGAKVSSPDGDADNDWYSGAMSGATLVIGS